MYKIAHSTMKRIAATMESAAAQPKFSLLVGAPVNNGLAWRSDVIELGAWVGVFADKTGVLMVFYASDCRP